MNGSTASPSSASTSTASNLPFDAPTTMPGALPGTQSSAHPSELVSQLAGVENRVPTSVNGSSGVRDRTVETAPKSPSARTKTTRPDAESWQPATAATTSSIQGGQRLSSSALAALQSESVHASTGPPARPPKSAARSQQSASIDQPVLEAEPDETHFSPDPASSPNVDSSATLTTTTPTIRAGLTHARPRPQVSTTLATTARHSIASSSTNSSPYPSRRSAAYFTDDSDWTGGPTSSALETPSTTADYSASNSSSPMAPAAGKGRPPPLPLDAQSKTGELAGLGLDFLAPPPPPPSSGLLDSSARTSFDEVDLERGMERLSQYARTLPSPFPSVMAGTGASPVSDSPVEDRTLVFEPTATPHSSDVPPPLPPLVRPSVSASEPTSPASNRPLPLLGVTTTSLSVANSRDSALERLAPPAVSGRAFESETDFFSTDFTDADDYDEGDDSFSLYPVATQRRTRQASAGSFQRATSAPLDAQLSGGNLWSEDVPNWEGALPRPGDGVVDWTECRLERQALPPGALRARVRGGDGEGLTCLP